MSLKAADEKLRIVDRKIAEMLRRCRESHAHAAVAPRIVPRGHGAAAADFPWWLAILFSGSISQTIIDISFSHPGLKTGPPDLSH